MEIKYNHSNNKTEKDKRDYDHRHFQKKQKRGYDHRHWSKTEIRMDDTVLLKNNKRFDRKGGKLSQKWLGPYTVVNIYDKGVVT